MGIQIGGSKEKAKTNQQSTSEYTPYAPAEPLISNALTGLQNYYDTPQQFMGGFDADNFLTPFTENQQDIIAQGGSMFNLANDPRFATSDAVLNSYMGGQPTSIAGNQLLNLAQGQTGTSLDQFNAGTAPNAFNMMNTPTSSYLDNLQGTLTNNAVNRISSEMAGMGRFDPNSATFASNVAQTYGDSINPYLFDLENKERQREFDANINQVNNMFNAGSTITDNAYKASSGLRDDEINIAKGTTGRITDFANLQNNLLNSSFGFDNMLREMTDAEKQIQVAELLFAQDNPYNQLINFLNPVMSIASGFPVVNQQGTSSSKQSGFGFGFEFGA